MFPELINFEHLSAVQQTIEGLTDIWVSIYDGDGRPVLSPPLRDPVLSLVTSSKTGREEYNNFIKDTINTSILRNEISIFKSPSNQYHFFIPCHINEITLILVGGAFFLSLTDFNEFISKSTYKYQLSIQQIEAFSKKILIMDYEKIQEVSLYIQKLFYSSVKNGYENRLYSKKYQRTKTILRLLSNVEEDISLDGIHALMSDILIFLFSVDSLSLMEERGSVFKTVFSAGRLKEHIANLNFNKSTWLIYETIKGERPIFYDNPVDIRDLGLEKQIESIYLFPIFSNKMGTRLLCLFNTTLKKKEVEEVSELCQLINFLSATVSVQNEYSDRMKEMTILNFATSGLNLMFDQPEVLYTSILDTAVRISKAEKGSLMLADNGEGELSIKAVHGINRLLLKDLKIQPGEGIAGKVFKENIPIISKDIEKDFSVRSKPRYKTSSFISIPLKVGEETIGVLNVSDKITGEIFSEEDLALIHYFGNYASIVLKGSAYYNIAEYMKELSITDSLTNLYNRRYFQERLSEEIDRSERHNLNFSLCIIDIDDFKLFNDTEGHPAGDYILKRISRLIHESLRAIDVLARIGGEEFAVIMPQTEKHEASLVAERIRNTVKQKLEPTWKFYPKKNITVSIGISTFPSDGVKSKKLIVNADKALYRGKMQGKDRTITWEEYSSI